MRSPQYINLAIIEHFVNNFCHWSTKHDKSEATFYRHFASILDILLADTDVIIADDETGLQSSKVAIAMNKAVFHTGDLSQSYGHKIDMILKCSTTTNVDISSNEWKKANVSKCTTIAIPANMESLGALKEALEGLLTYLRIVFSPSLRKSIWEISDDEYAAVLEDIGATPSTRSWFADESALHARCLNLD
ncbi:predicted protein [Lichtheimia corymbifera JMRC:FSU:9682]|uniref:Uncharacterized protein n=1 Tax=Lichtheimia corymbifera JMRC:FSU:9682 TaxID=1263082 RepID=A0A068SAA3_9FUNG|nr:predicted protein [Lichtheimia corymbifera JMRC:FSU:9682]